VFDFWFKREPRAEGELRDDRAGAQGFNAELHERTNELTLEPSGGVTLLPGRASGRGDVQDAVQDVCGGSSVAERRVGRRDGWIERTRVSKEE
jgi:hypothetical protein